MNRFRVFLTAGMGLIVLSGLTGCAEMQALRQRAADQEKLIRSLQDENKQFQDAYYQIKQTMDSEVGKTAKQSELLQRDLDQARNLRSQKETELATQLRTRGLELEALRGESEETRKLNETRIAQLDRDKQTLDTERQTALASLAERDEALRKEQEHGAALTQQADRLTAELKTAQDALAGLRQELDTARKSLQQHQQQLTAAEQAQRQAGQELEQLRGQLAEANKLGEQDKRRLEELTAQNKQLTDKATQYEQTLDQAGKSAGRADELAKKNQQLEQELVKLKEQLKSGTGAAPSLADDPELKAAAERFQQQLKREGAPPAPAGEVSRLDAAGLRILLPSDALFKQGAIVLSDNAPALLEPVAELLAGLPDREIRIEGHTDNQPVEDLPFADNWGLGFARADRVREFLMSHGKIAAARLTALSRAQFEPIADNADPGNRARNRRVEIVIGRKRS